MRKLVSLISLLAVAVVLSACQTTSINSAWFDPNFNGGPMKKIDVVALGTNLANRRVAEDVFAQKLRDAGVDGVAGWTVIPDEARAAQGPFTEAVTRTGAQGLLVVRLLGVDTRTQVTTTMVPTTGPMWGGPGWGRSWGGGWGGAGDVRPGDGAGPGGFAIRPRDRRDHALRGGDGTCNLVSQYADVQPVERAARSPWLCRSHHRSAESAWTDRRHEVAARSG